MACPKGLRKERSSKRGAKVVGSKDPDVHERSLLG